MVKQRDYAKEYREYQGTPEQIKRRASRNAARRKMVKAKRARKGDGKDVDHKDGNPMHNGDSNLRVVSKETNRAKKALLDVTRLLPVARALIALDTAESERSQDREQALAELKAFVEKYGARNSRVDQAAIQDAHDLMVRLGAMCGSKDG